jgi:hypothetical protein
LRSERDNSWLNKAYNSDDVTVDYEDFMSWRDWYIRTWVLCLKWLMSNIKCFSSVNVIRYEDLISVDVNESVNVVSKIVFDSVAEPAWKEDLHFVLPVRQSGPMNKNLLSDEFDRISNEQLTELIDLTSPACGDFLKSNIVKF